MTPLKGLKPFVHAKFRRFFLSEKIDNLEKNSKKTRIFSAK